LSKFNIVYRKRRPQLGQRADRAFVNGDDVEVETTSDHHIKLGFKHIIVFAKSLSEIDEDTLTQVTTVYVDTFADDCIERTVNTLMPHMAGAWVYVGFNAEYLFSRFPVRARLRNCWPFIPKNAVDRC
jgi:hypothetical protein